MLNLFLLEDGTGFYALESGDDDLLLLETQLFLKDFAGWETGGLEEGTYTFIFDPTTEVLTSPAPPVSGETYVLRILSGNGVGRIASYISSSHEASGDFIWGAYLRFSNLTGTPETDLIVGKGNNSNIHIRVRLRNDAAGNISLINAGNSVVATATGVVEADTWHRFELRWSKASGYADLFIDGTSVISVSGQTFDTGAGPSTTIMDLRGQQGLAVNVNTVYVNSHYYFVGGMGTSDFLGEFRVVGPYQETLASFTPHVGNNLNSSSSGSQWSGVSRTPSSGDVCIYDAGNSGYVATSDGSKAGPKGDSRIEPSNRLIKGSKWVFHNGGLSNCWALWGKHNGSAGFTSGNFTMSKQEDIVSFGPYLERFQDRTETKSPHYDEHFAYGFTEDSDFGPGSGTLREAWGFLLYVPPVVVTDSINLFVSGSAAITVVTDDIDLFVRGHITNTDDIDLFIHGFEVFVDSIDLFIHGHEQEEDSIDLFVHGLGVENDDIDLFVEGAETETYSIDLFVDGKDQHTENIDLFVHGKDTNSNDCDLFVNCHETETDDIDLFVKGLDTESNDIDLFIEGKQSDTDDCDLFVHGHDTETDNIDLFVRANETETNSIDLYINGLGVFSDSLTLFISSINTFSDDMHLFVKGIDTDTDSIDLFVRASATETESIDLFIDGLGLVTSGIDLFVMSFGAEQDDIDLFIHGFATITDNIDLLVSGIGLINDSITFFIRPPFEFAEIDFLINGFEPLPSAVCFPPDPNAAFQIPNELVTIYQDNIDALVNQLGKNILIEFDPIITDCPNCEIDNIRHRSRGIYRIGGPVPFSRGQQCPYCKGNGQLTETPQKCIKALIKWNPKELDDYGISVADDKAKVRVKTFLTDFDDLVRARTIIVDYDQRSVTHLRARRIGGINPIGLREDRYCISYWELI